MITHIALNKQKALPPQNLTDMGNVVYEAVDADPNTPRILWARTSPEALVISSDVSPEWDLIPGAVRATMERPDYHNGQRIHWSATVAPVRTVSPRSSSGKAIGKGKKIPLIDRREVEEWTQKKLVSVVEIHGRMRVQQLPRPHNAPLMWHVSGSAKVIDGIGLAALQAAGIGRQKSRGCGLLIITPARRSHPAGNT